MAIPRSVYPAPFNTTRASHVVLTVKDLGLSRDFYCDALGFAVSDQDGGTLYLRGIEEACHHSLVLKRLRDKGIANPTSKDAAQYFEQISGYETDWERFFEYDYDNRIRAIHPDNRFGAEAIPQFDAEDFIDLSGTLTEFFRFFVSEFPK